MSARARASLAVPLFAFALAAGGCEEKPGFMEPTKVRETIMDLRNQIVDGQRRLEFRVHVPGGVTHPSFIGLWTFRDREKPLHVYVVRAAEYDSAGGSASDLATLPNYFMLRPEVNTIHVHPTPGDWVIVLRNPAAFGPVTRAEVTGTIVLSFWR